VCAIAGCGGSGQPVTPIGPGTASSTSHTVTGPLVYFFNGYSIDVYAPPAGASTEAPIATIAGSNTGLLGNTTGDYLPQGIAIDGSGQIYVTTENNSVTVYSPNPVGSLNEAPLATIAGSNTGLDQPVALALDPGGKIYVANQGNHSVTVYAAHPSGTMNETPLATIAGNNTGLAYAEGIALDGGGNIYVSNMDPAMATAENEGSITVYAANPSGLMNEAPLATIFGSNTHMLTPGTVAVDGSGKIYVLNYYFGGGGCNVTIFAPNPRGSLNEAPLANGFTTGLFQCAALALDANGNIYVSGLPPQGAADPNPHIGIFAPYPSGESTAPLATLNTSGEGGIAVHSVLSPAP
jgi:sugar lactone lactonase YvrE